MSDLERIVPEGFQPIHGYPGYFASLAVVILLLVNLAMSWVLVYRQGSLKNLICNVSYIDCGGNLTLGQDWLDDGGGV